MRLLASVRTRFIRTPREDDDGMSTDVISVDSGEVWVRRVRIGAELMVAIGGAVLAVLAAANELREIESEAMAAIDDSGGEGGDDGVI